MGLELRMGVEMQAATLAAERRKAGDLKAMLGCLKQMEPNKSSFEQAVGEQWAGRKSATSTRFSTAAPATA